MIAITGASGVGKSSFVNAIRRIRETEPDAAATGVIETTTEPTVYTFTKEDSILQKGFFSQPGKRNLELKPGERVLLKNLEGLQNPVAVVEKKKGNAWAAKLEDGKEVEFRQEQVAGVAAECVIWDLPGIGTPSYPQVNYLKRMGIRYFDVVLLMTSTRFTEAELMLTEELQKFQVPFFLIRNKVDTDVESEIIKEEDGLDGDDDALSEESRTTVSEQTVDCIKAYFQSEYGLNNVYCISTRRKQRKQFDYIRLENDVQDAVLQQRG